MGQAHSSPAAYSQAPPNTVSHKGLDPRVSPGDCSGDASPYYGSAHPMYGAHGLGGALFRNADLGDFYDGQSILGRVDAQQLGATMSAALPNIGGNMVEQMSAQAYHDGAYGMVDPFPMASGTRFNGFKTKDLRGDPVTPAMDGTYNSAGVHVVMRNAGTDEFFMRRTVDTVAPLPTIHHQHRGNHTYHGPTPSGYNWSTM